MSRYPEVEVFQRVPAKLGEGICWHPARGTVWWIDIVGQRYYESDVAGSPPRILQSAQMIGAVAPTVDGGLVAALGDGIYLVDPNTGRESRFATAPGHDATQFRFNDGKIDPRGRFWAGTLALDNRSGQSRLYRIDADKCVTTMHEGVSISNGLAWTADARKLYYIDSPTRTVQVFDFDLEHGTIGPPRVAITLGEADGWPDGCCMDAEDCLWIAHWGASKVTRWKPETATLLQTISLPVANVTSCAFGGEELDQLYITTAIDDGRMALEPEGGFLFRVDPKVTGPKLANFAGQ